MRTFAISALISAAAACAHFDAGPGTMWGGHYRQETARVTDCGASQIEISENTSSFLLGRDFWTATGCGRTWKCNRLTRDASNKAECVPQ